MVNVIYFKVDLIFLVIILVFSVIAQPPHFDFRSLYTFPDNTSGILKCSVFIKSSLGICSGSIIEESWVLTAAQCFYSDGKQVGDSEVNITAGIIDYKHQEVSGTSRQDRTSKRIIVHPDYRENVLSKYDLALIKTEKPFNFTSSSLGIVKIADSTWPAGSMQYKKCVMWGFGNIEPGIENPNTGLKMRKVEALHGNHACPCTKRFQWQRLICLKQVDGVSLCNGDAGSSLLCYDGSYPNENDTFIYGVSHMIMTKAACGYEREPPRDGCSKIPVDIVYMYLCPFNDWIRSYVPKVPHTPISCKGSRIIFKHVSLYSMFLLVLKF